MTLKPCPACGAKKGELVEAAGARFPFHVKCGACGWVTDSVKLLGIAEKLWNEAKKNSARPNRLLLGKFAYRAIVPYDASA